MPDTRKRRLLQARCHPTTRSGPAITPMTGLSVEAGCGESMAVQLGILTIS